MQSHRASEKSESERWSVNSVKSEGAKYRADMLRKQREKRPEKYAAAYKQCPKCEKHFKTKRDVKWHMKQCRLEGVQYYRIKVDGTYPCQICSVVNTTMVGFKRHVFYRHSDAQVD